MTDYIKTYDRGLIPKETTLLDDLVAACPAKDTEILDWIENNMEELCFKYSRSAQSVKTIATRAITKAKGK